MPRVSIIIPTKNEEGNIKPLLLKIWDALIPYTPELSYEVVVIDDGFDKTAMIARHYGAKVVYGRGRGLGQAIIDGVEVAQGDIIVVMDADGSHPPSAIPHLVASIVEHGIDVAVGSRYVQGGETIGWSPKRKVMSRLACLCALPVTRVRDATSGFFAFRRNLLDGHIIEAGSWKILLEILAKTDTARVEEIPIRFRDRVKGKSKFSVRQVLIYLKHIVKLVVHKYRIIKFMCVGGVGYAVNIGTYYPLTLIFKNEVTFLGQHFYLPPFVISSLIAMFCNYEFNRLWTFRGWREQPMGGLRYFTMATVTLVLDLALLYVLVDYCGLQPLAGATLAILIIFIVRFSIARRWIWHNK